MYVADIDIQDLYRAEDMPLPDLPAEERENCFELAMHCLTTVLSMSPDARFPVEPGALGRFGMGFSTAPRALVRFAMQVSATFDVENMQED